MCVFTMFPLLEMQKQGPVAVSTCDETRLSLIDHQQLLMACMSMRWWLVVYKVHPKGGGVLLECLNSLFKIETVVQGSPRPLQLGKGTEDGRGNISNSVKTQQWENCLGHVSVIGPTVALTLTSELSKCYLLGRLYMTNATELNWGGRAKESHADDLKWRHWCFLCS